MTDGQPTRPANILQIVAINQGQAPLTMGEPTAPALGHDDFAERMAGGQVVIDTRVPAGFGAGHVPGAYNIKLASPEFEQRIGWVAPAEAPLLLVLEAAAALPTALHKLAFVGLDSRVQGFLAGGMDAWSAAGKPQETLAQISVSELQRALEGGNGMRVLDVREPDEWHQGHVRGAATMSFKVLEQHLADIGVAPHEEVAVMCAGGVRSSTACSILLRHGYRGVHNVTGGMGAWRAASLPTVTD